MSSNYTGCGHCNYRWKSRVSKPKECPACKSRIYHEKPIRILKRIGRELGYNLDISQEMKQGGFLSHG